MWDYAVNGVPFLAGQSQQYPYRRDSRDARAEQLDTTGTAGENSLTGWWYRSQLSFHQGAGAVWLDAGRGDDSLQYRFADSEGVDVWTPGEVSLLPLSYLRQSSTATWGRLVSVSNGGVEGVLAIAVGASSFWIYRADGTSDGIGGYGGTTLDLTTNQNLYYLGTTDGIYSGNLPSGAPTKQYSWIVASGKMTWSQQRLWACGDKYIWALAGAAANTVLDTDPTGPTEAAPIFVHPINGWTWRAIAGASDGVFFAGTGADISEVYFATWDPQTEDYITPRLVATMPKGEAIHSMEPYMGALMLIGTSRGLRVAAIGNSGQLIMGPLTVETEYPCYDVAVGASYVWAAGAAQPPTIPSPKPVLRTSGPTSGLYRMDISQQLQDGIFPYARDMSYTGATGTGVRSVAFLGQTDRLAYWVGGIGLVIQEPTGRVASGWLETGKIRMGTLERKLFQFLRIFNFDSVGTVTAKWRSPAGTLATLYDWNADDYQEIDTEGSDGNPHLYVSYRFELAGTDPRLWGYQAKSLPSGVTQRILQVPMLCFDREKPAAGGVVERPVWPRVSALEQVQDKSAVVTFQDFGTGESELVVVEGVTFMSTAPPLTQPGRANKGGMLVLNLRVV